MRIAYVDDTRQRGRRAHMGSLTALGAALFEEEQIQPFAQQFRELFEEFDLPTDLELKWSNSQSANWWTESEENRGKQTPVRRRVLEIARTCKVRVIVVVWDEGGGVSTAGGDSPQDAVIKFMFERITIQMTKTGHRGLIVFDKPEGSHKAEANWLTGRSEMVLLGTDYVKPEAIVTQILTAPSHLHPHLQLADLVAGSVTAAVGGNRHGIGLLPFIKPMMCTNYRGQIAGTGLKLYPDRLNNLHHWLLNEDEMTRGGASISLPHRGWPYYSGDNAP